MPQTLDEILEEIEDDEKKRDDLFLNPVKAATTPVVGNNKTGVDNKGIPPEAIQQLLTEAGIAKKQGLAPSVYSDAELGAIMQFDPNDPRVAEIEKRRQIDASGITDNLSNPDYLDRLIRNAGSGFGEALGSDLVGLGGLATSGMEALTGADLNSAGMLNASEAMRKDIQKAYGISDPRGPDESLANIAGGMLSIPGVGPIKSGLGNAAELVTPFVVGGGVGRTAANVGIGFTIDQAVRELADDDGTAYKTIFDSFAPVGEDDQSYPEATRALIAGLGIFAGASIISPVVIDAMKKVKQGSTTAPVIRDVTEAAADAPTNLKTIETAKDLYKTYAVDEKTVLTDIARRAGMPDLASIKGRIDQDTQISGLMRVNEALRTGKLRTDSGSFAVEVSPDQVFRMYQALPKPKQVDADRYLKLRDMTDDLNIRLKKKIKVDDTQKLLAQARRQISDIEKRTPEVLQLASHYRGVMKGVRNFLSSGDNAMLSDKGLKSLSAERENYVPIDFHSVNATEPLSKRLVDVGRSIDAQKADAWFLQRRDLKHITDIDSRVDAFETMIDYTRTALRRKMENDVRGQYVRGIRDSAFGSETVRPRSKDETGKHNSRVVEIYEKGKKKQYLASKLQADLLRFDPNIPKFLPFYLPKRLFEVGTTGALSLTFAPTTLLRDAITGKTLGPKGKATTGLVASLTEVPRQLSAKVAREAAAVLDNEFVKLPFVDNNQRKLLATSLADKYSRSMLALANDVGGIDASLMRTNVELRKGAWREIARSIDDLGGNIPGAKFAGHSVHNIVRGWRELFGAIQDAPRAAYFRDAVKKGKQPRDAAVRARLITGDTSRSGRVYKPDGNRIDADAVDKSNLLPARMAGFGIELAREAIPYTNPTIQGLRRLSTRVVEDPIGVNLNAWKYVGMPAMAAFAWNESLGPEYNDYAMTRRSSRDQAMSIYIGLPGKHPRHGIEFPVGHEMMPWNAPWTTALYNLGRGQQEVGNSLKHMGLTVLQNGSMIGYPTVGGQLMTASGINPPDSIMTPMDDVYQIREDNVGFLPQNAEKLLRQTFGGITGLVYESAAAAYENGPQAFTEEFKHQWVKRIPIAKNLAGTKTSTASFTPLVEERQKKIDAYNEFIDLWDVHNNPEKGTRLRKNLPPAVKRDSQVTDVPIERLGPLPTMQPINPVFDMLGGQIKAVMGKNTEGMTALKSRYSLITKQLRLIRGFRAGSGTKFKQFQDTFKGATERYDAAMEELNANAADMSSKEWRKREREIQIELGEKAKGEQLINRLELDMSNRDDVLKFQDYLETERTRIASEQMKLINELEDRMTTILQEQKLMAPGQRFKIDEHLNPNDPLGR